MKNLKLISKVLGEAALSRVHPRIKHLILHVTNRCNMRCRHCFIDFSRPTEELRIDEFKTVARALPDLIWLDIGGGEPTLRDNLDEIVSLFKFEELAIPTNGWDVEQILKTLQRIHSVHSRKLIVALSLEGLELTHDFIRCPGSFNKTLETFNVLKGIKGMRVKFNTVLCEKNYDEILDLMSFVRDLNPAFHSILFLRGKPNDPSMKLPDLERIRKLQPRISEIQQSYNYGREGILSMVQRNYQRYKTDLIMQMLLEKKQVIPCLAGRSHLVVWSDGSIAPCELLPVNGNIKYQSLPDLLKNAKMKEIRATIKNRGCFCTHDCNMIENILFDVRSYLKLVNP